MRLKSLIVGGVAVGGVIFAGIFAANVVLAKYREKVVEFSGRLNVLNAQNVNLAGLVTKLDKELGEERKRTAEYRHDQRRKPVKWDPELKGTSVPIPTDRDTLGPFTPVAMAAIGDGQFLVALYSNIYFFDENKGTAVPVHVNGRLPLWNPTGIFYSDFYDQIFLANYGGEDVVVMKIERKGDEVSLDVVERITDGLKGPEGVTVSRGGRFMAVADHPGAQVIVYERENGGWKRLWSQPMESAHGVVFIGDRLYVGGVAIAKYDVLTGKEVARTASLGDEPLLFATCLNEDGDTGDLIGSDPMAGRVFLMSPDLNVKTIFGANGPTFANFSMPYCAYREGKAIYVLSTYQDRIVKIEGNATTSFELNGPRWQYTRPIFNSAAMWHGYDKFDSPSYRMFGKKVFPRYGSLSVEDGTTLLMPGRETIDDNEWPFYLTTIAEKDGWLVIVANSSPDALLYNIKSGALQHADLGEWDCWARATKVLCPSGAHTIASLQAESATIPEEPAPDNAERFLQSAKGTMTPMLDYWRAWKATTD